MADNRWGPGVDWESWNSLLAAGPESLTHELWRAVIRAVAAAVISKGRPDGVPSEHSVEDDAECLIAEWQDTSLPHSATLALVLGEYDYFRDIGLSWDEKVSLSGRACTYAADAVGDLHCRLDGLPDAQEAVSEESVEDFYVEWRTRFLKRVLREAAVLRAGEDA